MSRKLTKEEFVTRAKALHGDKFNYSKVVYVNANTRVLLTCIEHGDFLQTPASHLDGKGCKKCAGLARSNTEEFIVKAKNVHGDKYDYSKVCYHQNKKKVVISCKNHGDFEQTPNSHLKGVGCLKCSGKEVLTKETFIAKAIVKHGVKYDYSGVIYNNAHGKVKIVCSEHGEFIQTAYSHLAGRGCYECGNIIRSKKLRDEFEVFVDKANNIHANLYIYEQLSHEVGAKKIKITCKEHGVFIQTASSHLNGRGCPKCAKSGYKVDLPATFYLISIGDEWLGFGITNDFKTRYKKHQSNFKKAGKTYSLIGTYNCTGHQALSLETHIKQSYPIIDTEIEGFRKEATDIKHLPEILEWLKTVK